METIREYIIAPTIDYAVHQLARGGVRIVAGGTGLVERRNRLKETKFLDITRMGLDRVERRRNGLRIGATVTLAGLAEHAATREYAGGVIARVAGSLATPPLRNMITVGGNLLAGFSWSDLPPLWLVLDARASFLGENGKRRLPLTEFFTLTAPERSGLGLLTHLELPPASGDHQGWYRSRRPQAHGFSQLGVALAARRRRARLENLHIAVSGCLRRPQRLERLEEELPELTPGSEEFRRAIRTAVSALAVQNTLDLSADYARVLLEEYLGEGLVLLWKGETACT